MRYTLAQTLLRRSRSAVAAAFDGLATCTYFHCAYGFLHPQTRIYHKLLGPCFKTIELLEILAKSPLWTLKPDLQLCSAAQVKNPVVCVADSYSTDLILPFELEK